MTTSSAGDDPRYNTPEADAADLSARAEADRWIVWYTVVIAVSILVYICSWNGALVWDDHFLVDGSAIGGGKSLWSCITTPFLGHYFRPLVSIWFFFERKVWHDIPTGYRIVSTLLHGAVTGALIGVLRSAFSSARAAALGALLFAVQPVQVGAVAWIGGRTDALAELWLILLFSCLIRAARSTEKRGKRLAWSVFWFTLAIFTKEQCLALLPLIPLAFRCWRPKDSHNNGSSVLVFSAPFVAVGGLFLFLGYHLGMPRPSLFPPSLAEYLAQMGRILAFYLLALLSPTPQLLHTLTLGALERAGSWPIAIGYLSVAACTGLLIRWRRRDPASAWFLCLTLLSLAPVSGILPLPFLLVAPYRAAIGGIGVAAILGRWLDIALEERGVIQKGGARNQIVARAAAGALIAWYTALTAWGAYQWRGEVNLFTRIVRADPDAVVSHYVLAFMVGGRNDYASAAVELEDSLRNLFGSDAWKRPDTAMAALRNDSRILYRARQNQGSTDEPHIWVASIYNTLAQVYMKQNQRAGALAAYQVGEAINPKDPDIQSGIGYCNSLVGNEAEAVRRMRKAIALMPTHEYSHEWLARHYSQQGKWQEAVPELQAWVNALPDSEEAKTMLRDAETQVARRRSLDTGTLFGGGLPTASP